MVPELHNLTLAAISVDTATISPAPSDTIFRTCRLHINFPEEDFPGEAIQAEALCDLLDLMERICTVNTSF